MIKTVLHSSHLISFVNFPGFAAAEITVEILNRRAKKKVSKSSTEEYRTLLTSTHMHKSRHSTGNNAGQVTWKKELFTIVNIQ